MTLDWHAISLMLKGALQHYSIGHRKRMKQGVNFIENGIHFGGIQNL